MGVWIGVRVGVGMRGGIMGSGWHKERGHGIRVRVRKVVRFSGVRLGKGACAIVVRARKAVRITGVRAAAGRKARAQAKAHAVC